MEHHQTTDACDPVTAAHLTARKEYTDALILKFIPMAYHLAKRMARYYGIPHAERDDMESEALLAITKAAATFDETRGCQPSTYMWIGIKMYLRKFIHKFYRRASRNMISTVEYDGHEELAVNLLIDDSIKEENVDELLDGLDRRSKDILVMRYQMGYTLEECGQKYNLSKERIRQIEAKAFDRICKSGKITNTHAIKYTSQDRG